MNPSEQQDNFDQFAKIENEQIQNDLKTLSQEEFEEVTKKPEDAEPIKLQRPEEEKIKALRETLSKLSPDQLNSLMTNISKKNNINPENVNYSTATNKEMLKERLRRKINQKNLVRSNNTKKNYEKQKYEEQMQQYNEVMKAMHGANNQNENGAEQEHVHGESCEHVIEKVGETVVNESDLENLKEKTNN